MTQYDNNGNVLNDGVNTYAWDADGNSITVDAVGATFDALDRMVEQNRSSVYTEIVYSPTGAKLALMSGTTGQTLQNAFINLPGQATAVYTSSGLDHYRHSDWLGSARLTSSPSRTILSATAYAPFGETYATYPNPSASADPSFTGQNSDTVSGEYDFLYREYSTQGRWPQPDPAGLGAVDPTNPQSWNRYAYVLNNPLRATDPLGLDCIYDEGGGNVTIVGGDCYSDTDNGYYVDGTVQDYYIDQNGDLQFTFNPYNTTPGFIGAGFGRIGGFLDNPYDASIPSCVGGCGMDLGALQYQQYQGLQVLKSIATATAANGEKMICGNSMGGRILTSMRNGAIVGGVSGAAAGFVDGEFFFGTVTFGTSGIGGAALGGFVGGTTGAVKGVFSGFVLAMVCNAEGGYN